MCHKQKIEVGVKVVKKSRRVRGQQVLDQFLAARHTPHDDMRHPEANQRKVLVFVPGRAHIERDRTIACRSEPCRRTKAEARPQRRAEKLRTSSPFSCSMCVFLFSVGCFAVGISLSAFLCLRGSHRAHGRRKKNRRAERECSCCCPTRLGKPSAFHPSTLKPAHPPSLAENNLYHLSTGYRSIRPPSPPPTTFFFRTTRSFTPTHNHRKNGKQAHHHLRWRARVAIRCRARLRAAYPCDAETHLDLLVLCSTVSPAPNPSSTAANFCAPHCALRRRWIQRFSRAQRCNSNFRYDGAKPGYLQGRADPQHHLHVRPLGS